MNLYEKLIALKDAIPTADVTDIWTKFKAVGDHVFGPGRVEMGSATKKTAGCGPDECDSVAAEIKSVCERRLTEVGADETKKIGDGTLLKIILEALPMILSLFRR